MRTGLLFGGLGMGVCLVGVAGLALWNVQVVMQASGPVRETTDGFFREVSTGEADKAYERLCADTRRRWSAVGFDSWIRTPPLVSGYDITDVSIATRGGRPRATVTVLVIRDGGAAERRAVPVVQENRSWRVCGDPF